MTDDNDVLVALTERNTDWSAIASIMCGGCIFIAIIAYAAFTAYSSNQVKVACYEAGHSVEACQTGDSE